MRPATLVDAIVETAIAARRRQIPLLLASRSSGPDDADDGKMIVPATRSGHLVRVDTAALLRVLADRPDLRVVIRPAIGDLVTVGEALAQVSGDWPIPPPRWQRSIRRPESYSPRSTALQRPVCATIFPARQILRVRSDAISRKVPLRSRDRGHAWRSYAIVRRERQN